MAKIDVLETIKNDTEPVLNSNHVEKATAWALKHRAHVESLAQLAAQSYPPTLNEDKRDPALWKAGHWNWFLKLYPLPANNHSP